MGKVIDLSERRLAKDEADSDKYFEEEYPNEFEDEDVYEMLRLMVMAREAANDDDSE